MSVLYDAKESEVHALIRTGEGILYAATAQADRSKKKLPTAGNVNRQDGGSSAPESGSQGGGGKDRRRSANNSIYRIEPGKGATRVMQLEQILGLSLATNPGGELLVGTGGRGRVLALNEEGNVNAVKIDGADDVTAMIFNDQQEVIIGTSNTGQLLKRAPAYTERGHFITRVYDAGYLSQWGRVNKELYEPQGTSVDVQIRVGNTAEPGEEWTKWTDAEGEGEELPLSRFCQLRAILTTDKANVTPELLTMTAYFRQSNRRPVIQKLAINGDNSRGGKGQSSNDNGGNPRKEKNGTRRMIRWQGTDPNGDSLEYSLYYRGLHEQGWKTVEKDIQNRSQANWDTKRIPDGQYVLRLVATDRRARAKNKALTDSKISAPFLIDNTRPLIMGLKGREGDGDGIYRISGKVKDAGSVVQACPK